jgi:hypothetical protein
VVLSINLPIVAAVLIINMFFLCLCWRRAARGLARSRKLS